MVMFRVNQGESAFGINKYYCKFLNMYLLYLIAMGEKKSKVSLKYLFVYH